MRHVTDIRLKMESFKLVVSDRKQRAVVEVSCPKWFNRFRQMRWNIIAFPRKSSKTLKPSLVFAVSSLPTRNKVPEDKKGHYPFSTFRYRAYIPSHQSLQNQEAKMAAVGQKLDNRQFEVRSSASNSSLDTDENLDHDRHKCLDNSSPSLRPHLHQSQQIPSPLCRRRPLHLCHPLPHRRHSNDIPSPAVQPDRDRHRRGVESSTARPDAHPRPRRQVPGRLFGALECQRL